METEEERAFLQSIYSGNPYWVGVETPIEITNCPNCSRVWSSTRSMVLSDLWDVSEPTSGEPEAFLNAGNFKLSSTKAYTVTESSSLTNLFYTMCEKTSSVTPGLLVCPEGYTPVNSSCYRVFENDPKNWTEAFDFCISEGGALAEPKDSSVNDMVRFALLMLVCNSVCNLYNTRR